jgi:hypothetical protein
MNMYEIVGMYVQDYGHTPLQDYREAQLLIGS